MNTALTDILWYLALGGFFFLLMRKDGCCGGHRHNEQKPVGSDHGEAPKT
jgi:hypothetical protein